MILNAYAILDAFVILLRLAVALLVVGLGISAWRAQRRGLTLEGRGALEDFGYLLLLLAFLLLVLNIASWPLLYLLLESYIPEWPGVMCIYGVMQVGTGSQGASRFLPGLLRALQVFKPALVFGSGAWMMLYVANRRTAHSPLLGRILIGLIALGILAGVDAAAEAAYLLLPKKEVFLSAGCCTGLQEGSNDRFVPSAIIAESQRSWLWAAYYVVNGGMILGLFAFLRRQSSSGNRPGLLILLAGAAITLSISGVFLIDIAAPALLRLPQHHCPYDLIHRAPESLLAIVSFACGTFAVGWACVAAWFANCPETQPFLAEQVRKVLVVGLFGYLGALVMLSVEFVLV